MSKTKQHKCEICGKCSRHAHSLDEAQKSIDKIYKISKQLIKQLKQK